MFLEESPEQQQLRAELRQYYRELLTDEVRAGLAEGGEGGAAWSQVVRQIGKDGWLGIGWPTRVRRAGPAGDGPVHLLRRDPARRCAVPLRHHQHRRADHHALRHRRAEVVLPAADPRRRAQLRHRLHRARGRHRPGLVAHAGRARRRGVRRQRREDLHQWRRPGRLRVAGRADRPGRSQAQGHLDPVRAHDLGRLRVVDHPHRRRADDDADLLRQRARPRDQPCRGRERGLAHDHHPAQPRACRPGRVERSGDLALRGHRGVGGGAADRRRQDADRPGLGADGSRQVPRRAPGHVAAQLAHGGARGRRGSSPAPSRHRSRSSGPSASSR